MNIRNIFLCAFLLFTLSGCESSLFFREHEDFVKVKGTHFTIGGKPYYYAGTNLWYGCYLGSPGRTGDRKRLLRELDTLQAHGITNLRILAASEESYLKRAIVPALQRAPGIVDDSLVEGLDFLLAEMAKRRMRAVLFLTNYWEWSGGMAQYMAWATDTIGADPEDPQKGYLAFMDYSARFYSTPKAVRYYLDYVDKIVTRKNSVNGRMYAEDPVIMAWQLSNEPRPGSQWPGDFAKANLPAYYAWIDQSARYIHSLDTNHLVSTGNEGLAGSLQLDDCYLDAHKTPAIDYLTVHIWPFNWQWFNPNKIDETLPSSEAKTIDCIAQHISFARALQKPIVLEEFGLDRDSASFKPASTTKARDHFFLHIFGALYDSAKAGAPIAGSNFWAWSGEGKAGHADGIWRKGDMFIGDPPQELQGHNSIFSTDTSTLRIITGHAFKMQKLGSADSAAGFP
jgi:mannan endo-1,4-beta-mannosidase